MIETKTRTIDGHSYAVTMFPARRALALKARLLSIAGPAILAAVGSVKKGGSVLDAEVEGGALSTAAQKLVDNLSKDNAVDLVMDLLASTRRDGVEITEAVFDMEFAGRLDTMYRVLWFVLEVNFGSFFAGGKGIGAILDRFKAEAPKAEAATA